MKRAANKRYLTQWGAQFYVAAELSRRNYLVTFTFGNAPTTDLLVVSPNEKAFRVEVKGQKTHNFWLIKKRMDEDNLFYILVYLPKKITEQPRFFIMTTSEVMTERENYRVQTDKRGKYKENFGGFNWSTVYKYENQWEKLPH